MCRLVWFCLAATLWTGGARADWEFTKWGMSEKEVAQASGNPTLPNDPAVALIRRHYAALGMQYEADGHIFQASFFFHGSGLEKVKLVLMPGQDGSRLDGLLRAKHGDPVRELDGAGRISFWRADNNDIVLNNSKYRVSIIYRRIRGEPQHVPIDD